MPMLKTFATKIAGMALFMAAAFVHAELPIQTWALENGARVMFVQRQEIPMVDVRLTFDAGSRREPVEKVGLASLTNNMLARGVLAKFGQNAMSESQISDQFADMAARRASGVSDDSASVSVRTLTSSPEQETSMALLAKILSAPAFPADLLAREKSQMRASLQEAKTKPAYLAAQTFLTAIYGDHPYGRALTEAGVASITQEDLIEFHQKHYVANRLIIAIVGDVSRTRAEAIAKELTQHLVVAEEALPALPAVLPLKATMQRIPHPASQAHIMFGMPAEAIGDPDHFALTVGNYILGGGGFVSRLMNEVREKKGLSYSVYSHFSPKMQKGVFKISLQTKKKQTAQALAVAREVLNTFLEEGPTDEELTAAKNYLSGSFPMQLDANSKILNRIAAIGYYRLPLTYLDAWVENIAKVSKDEVKAAFSRKVSIDALSTVIVGAPE